MSNIVLAEDEDETYKPTTHLIDAEPTDIKTEELLERCKKFKLTGYSGKHPNWYKEQCYNAFRGDDRVILIKDEKTKTIHASKKLKDVTDDELPMFCEVGSLSGLTEEEK